VTFGAGNNATDDRSSAVVDDRADRLPAVGEPGFTHQMNRFTSASFAQRVVATPA